MHKYRVVLDGWNRTTNDSYRVVLIREGWSPRDAVKRLSTIYLNLTTGEANTVGGFGHVDKSTYLNEWNIVSIRKSRAKKPCSVEGNNHSSDRVTVYQGKPEPSIMCGYHASQL